MIKFFGGFCFVGHNLPPINRWVGGMEHLGYCHALACGQGEPQLLMHFQPFIDHDKQSNTQIQIEGDAAVDAHND